MNAQPHPSGLLILALGAFVVWRLVMRFRRMAGRQRLSPLRPWLTVVFFPLLLVLVGFSARHAEQALLGLAAGALLGAALGVYGLKLTRFEATPAGLFYTPSLHLGIALSLLLVLRLGYRLLQLRGVFDPAGGPNPQMAQSPLTLLLFAMLAAYYVAYAIGLLRWRRRVAAGLGVAST
jgi:hypothetical protein